MSDAYSSPPDPPPEWAESWSLAAHSPPVDPLYRASLAVAEAKVAGRNGSSGGWWLLLTLGLFMLSLMGGGFGLAGIALIVVVLVIHELGHYLGMLWFGYRDVRMFFIPFFGAAVSGRKHGAPAWQQLIVLFLGPLPGMVAALVLYAALRPPLGSQLGAFVFWLMIINAFNLLPFVPLDGGRILNLLLFRRHPLWESVFQCFAVASMGGLALAMQSIIFGFLAVFMLLAVPARYKQTRLACRARREHPELSAEFTDLDDAQRHQLFQYSHSLTPASQNPQLIGGHIHALHATIAEQSPAWLTSLAYLGLYGGSLGLMLLFAVWVGIDAYRDGAAQRETAAAEIHQLCDEVDELLAQAQRLEAQRPSDVRIEGDALKLRLKAAERVKNATRALQMSNPPLADTEPGQKLQQRIAEQEHELWNKNLD
jgi:Zn-dependent protease